MDSGIITIAIIGGFFFIALVIYLIVKPKGQVAGTEAKPAEEFSLQAAPGNGGSYKLWLKYDINWVGMEHAYGLTFDLDIRVDGQSCFCGELRTGSKAVNEEDRQKIREQILAGNKTLPEGVISPTKVNCSSGRSNGVRYERATMVVARTGSRRPESLVSVIGKVTPSEGTTVNSLYFFLAR
jgi:hypothetical protein